MNINHPIPESVATEGRELVIVVADDRFFLSHRLEVGMAAIAKGWNVTIAGGENGSGPSIEAAGFGYIPLPSPHSGQGPISSMLTIRHLVALFHERRDAVFHFVGVKMILLGNLAAKIAGTSGCIINAYSGLGIAFQNPASYKARVISAALRILCRGKKNSVNIIQNHDDEEILNSRHIISLNTTEYIKGSGVNLKKFSHPTGLAYLPDGRMRVVFSGRLLKSKGVEDLIAAAELLRPRWENKVEFLICGACHHNPDSMRPEQMERLCDGKYIVWGGHINNMNEVLASSRIMAFPSYYREGVPLALIEASAAGLPIVTCDSVGCRDTIDGNGFLVEPRNPFQLAQCIERLLEDDDLCLKFGRRSRQLAEVYYDIKDVVKKHLDIYSRSLTSNYSV
ncbi:MAG: glycosyltransferase [Muribaculaceae bacterium]|nr:glycosyltransferase [Muribaculaceae bacterium]